MNQSMIAHRAVSTPRRGLVARLGHAFDVWRQRQALDRLESHMLNDIGLSRKDVHRETERPIWDAPSVWLR